MISARLGGSLVPVGVAASGEMQLSKLAFARMYPGWPGYHLFVNADVGLVDIDNLNQWRTDIYKVGPLERWVEQGRVPDRLIASHAAAGKVDRTRPLCAYPKEAKWSGSGSTDDAANFTCVLPVKP